MAIPPPNQLDRGQMSHGRSPAVTVPPNRQGPHRPTGALCLAIASAVALASCSSGDGDQAAPANAAHGSGAHDGHRSGAAGDANAELAFLFPDGDDRGWRRFTRASQHHGSHAEVSLSRLAPAVRGELIRQLSLTAKLVDRYPTLAAATAAGYRRAGPFVPGMGTHYIGGVIGDAGAITDAEILRPYALLYDGISHESPLAGFMYLKRAASPGGPEPEGFAGPNDRWHRHVGVCSMPRATGELDVLEGEGTLSESACQARGGRYVHQTDYMVHVWTAPAYTSPVGVFAARNPALTCPDGTYHSVPNGNETRCRQP